MCYVVCFLYNVTHIIHKVVNTMNTILRLETVDGTGIYFHFRVTNPCWVQTYTRKYLELLGDRKRSELNEFELDEIYFDSLGEHKSISEEFLRVYDKDRTHLEFYNCGFETEEVLLNWFPLEGLIAFVGHGIYVSYYERKEGCYHSSEIQTIFQKDYCKLLYKVPLEDFIEERL